MVANVPAVLCVFWVLTRELERHDLQHIGKGVVPTIAPTEQRDHGYDVHALLITKMPSQLSKHLIRHL